MYLCCAYKLCFLKFRWGGEAAGPHPPPRLRVCYYYLFKVGCRLHATPALQLRNHCTLPTECIT